MRRGCESLRVTSRSTDGGVFGHGVAVNIQGSVFGLVCILRDVSRSSEWLAGYGSGPLRAILTDYDAVVTRAGPYTISVRAGTTP